MNEVIINTMEIESIWEKDNLCFIKMKSGKVWLCDEYQIIHTGVKTWKIRTTEYVKKCSCGNCLAVIRLSKKGKGDGNGRA